MAAVQPKSANSDTITRDARYLLELCRESPIPIVFQIGPYAAKIGAKPNTIIKRLAGIKARHGLKISTTLGKYERPPPPNAIAQVQTKVESGQRDHVEVGNHDTEVHPTVKSEEPLHRLSDEMSLPPCIDIGLQTPTTSVSEPNSSPHSFRQHQPYPSFEQFNPIPFPLNTHHNHPKRVFEQIADSECENLDIDGRAYKKIRVE